MELIIFIEESQNFFAIASFLSFAALAIWFLIYMYKKTLAKKTNKFFIGFGAFFFLVLLSCLLFSKLSVFYINQEIDRIISDKDLSVFIDGKKIPNPNQFVVDFNKTVPIKTSGSSPTKSILVEISTHKESLTLDFRRDSRQANLYWVSYPEIVIFSRIRYVETETLMKYPYN